MPTTPKKKSYNRKTRKVFSGSSNTVKYSKAIIDNKFTLDPKKNIKLSVLFMLLLHNLLI